MIIAGKITSGDVVEAHVNANGDVDLICKGIGDSPEEERKPTKKEKAGSKKQAKDEGKKSLQAEPQELTQI